MEHHLTNETSKSTSFNENFDCNKMRNLLISNSKQSFSERFSNWVNEYTRETRDKIWTDIEYLRSK